MLRSTSTTASVASMDAPLQKVLSIHWYLDNVVMANGLQAQIPENLHESPKRKPRRRPLSFGRKQHIESPDFLQPPLSLDKSLYFKKLMIEMLRETLGIFNESAQRKMEYIHWCVNPIHFEISKYIFSDHMQVRGCTLELRPWKRGVPTPHLAISSAYLRLAAVGAATEWTLGPAQDLRELSVAQIGTTAVYTCNLQASCTACSCHTGSCSCSYNTVHAINSESTCSSRSPCSTSS